MAGKRPESAWDASGVREAEHGVVAVDDTNHILAVSRRAADAVGYDPEELVGRRLVEIIPPRFRQSHVAGFTLHLVNGRAPLLDQEVTVPALCQDGSERLVRLLVRAVHLPGGGSVFVADLDLA